jgi:hypothetical protein
MLERVKTEELPLPERNGEANGEAGKPTGKPITRVPVELWAARQWLIPVLECIYCDVETRLLYQDVPLELATQTAKQSLVGLMHGLTAPEPFGVLYAWVVDDQVVDYELVNNVDGTSLPTPEQRAARGEWMRKAYQVRGIVPSAPADGTVYGQYL